MDKIEERLAHLIRQSDELSDLATEQSLRIAALERRVAFLIDRERGREEAAGSIYLADERPPHY